MRTSQIVFGERQHLLRVLDSVERSALPAPRLEQERRVIEQLIHARTQELNRINAGWDEKIGLVLSAEVKPDTLDTLSRQAPKKITICSASSASTQKFPPKLWAISHIILTPPFAKISLGIQIATQLRSLA